MKNVCFVFLCLFLGSQSLTAQSMIGDWYVSGQMPDGTEVTHKITFKEGGTMTVDMGNDGTVDVNSTYTMDGYRISMSDTDEASPCKGKVGVYDLVIEKEKMVAKLVEDACDARRGDGKDMVMTRKK